MKKINLLILSIVLLAIACSKDRSILLVEETTPTPVKPKDNFVAINNTTFDKLGTQPEKKTIKSDNDLPFVGKQGTQVWLFTRDLKLPNGAAVTYPFDIEMLELFTPKDMILHQMPTVSNGRLLTTAGEILIRAYKDGKELSIRQFNSTTIIVPAKSGRVDGFMGLFYGEETKDGIVNWVPADTVSRPNQGGGNGGSIFGEKDSYSIFPSRIGWINCDKFYNFTEAKTSVTFTSESPAIEKILIFLYFPDLQSVMQVYRGVSGEVPVGRYVKIIAYAVTEKEEYFSFFSEATVQDKQKVEIKLNPTTKEALIKYLETL
jgi:outer membrane protein assembly factor BamB